MEFEGRINQWNIHRTKEYLFRYPQMNEMMNLYQFLWLWAVYEACAQRQWIDEHQFVFASPLDGVGCGWCSFLAFQASFYRIFANCALRLPTPYTTHTHYPMRLGFGAQSSPLLSIMFFEHILFHFFSFSYSIRHCFMTGPVFDDVFRERGEKKTFITESYEWRVEPNKRRCSSLRRSELLRLGCVAIYLIVCQREKMSNMYKYCKDSPRFCVALIKRLEIR